MIVTDTTRLRLKVRRQQRKRAREQASITAVIIDVRNDYDTLVEYLAMKVRHCDWHGVSDAANDIRVFVAQHPDVELGEKNDL